MLSFFFFSVQSLHDLEKKNQLLLKEPDTWLYHRWLNLKVGPQKKWIHLYLVSMDPPNVPTLEDTDEGQVGFWRTGALKCSKKSSFWQLLKPETEVQLNHLSADW